MEDGDSSDVLGTFSAVLLSILGQARLLGLLFTLLTLFSLPAGQLLSG